MKKSIVARLTIIMGLVVVLTAAIVYYGADMRMSALYHSQKEKRVEYLAKSMSYGLRNVLVTEGTGSEAGRLVENVMRRAMSSDPSLTGCRVENRDGEELYSYLMPGVRSREASSVSVDVKSDTGRIGRITLYYTDNDILTDEKTQQVVAIAGTVASMVTYHMRRFDFFQVRFLAEKIIEEDPDVLYSQVTGPGSRMVYSHRMEEFEELIPDAVKRVSDEVSVLQPVVVQEVGSLGEYGRVVEVAVLVHEGGRRLGVVRIGYSTSSLSRAMAASRRALTLLVAGLTLLALGLGIALARSIARPLVDLTAVARTVSPAQFVGEMQLDRAQREIDALKASFTDLGDRLAARQDEIGELATSFKDLVLALDTYIKQLNVFYRRMSVADRLYAMGQLTAGIAHEINNPLTIISTYTQVMLKRDDLDPEMREEIETIKEEIARIAERVSELRSFSQETQFEFAAVDVYSALNKALSLFRYQINKAGVELETDFGDQPVFVRGDEGKLRQVFLNLLINALQSMSDSETKKLAVSAREDEPGGHVVIQFTDTGCGIDPDQMDRIFDPFFSTKKGGAGTGLGLSISYSIVETHNGRMSVESEPGKGSCFTVTLPPAAGENPASCDVEGAGEQ